MDLISRLKVVGADVLVEVQKVKDEIMNRRQAEEVSDEDRARIIEEQN